MDSPRQGRVTDRLRRPLSARAPPVMRIKKTARAQTITASVSNQPTISCHAGRANRKKFSGLPKIGSVTPEFAGAYQKSASVGHSADIAPPVAAAMTSETPRAMRRNTPSTGSFNGCPPMTIVWPLGKSGRCARFKARNDPYKTRNVTAVNAAKIPHCRPSFFQNTSAYPSDANQSTST